VSPALKNVRTLNDLSRSGQLPDRVAKLLTRLRPQNCDLDDQSVITAMRRGEKNSKKAPATDTAQTLL
jgi:hypothetical protein